MKNLKLLMLTLLLFVFMIPVKAMPIYSAQKTEINFQKQSDSVSMVVLAKNEKAYFEVQLRAKVPQSPFYNEHEAPELWNVDKRNATLENFRYSKNKFSHNFLSYNLPDKN